MSNVGLFLMNLSFIIIVLCAFWSNILTIVDPESSSMKGASIFINLCSLGLSTICSFEKKGSDMFRQLKQESHTFITPSSSKIFFMPKTKSTFSCISDTSVNTSNLWPWISITTGIRNNTPTYCPFPTCILCVLMQILAMHVMTCILNNMTLTYMAYLLPYLTIFGILYHLKTFLPYILVLL